MSTRSKRTKTLTALTALALAGTGTVVLSSSASAAPGGALVYGLTTDDRLVSFRSESLTASSGVEITGLRLDEDVVGIDVRPATGRVLGVTQGTTQDRIVSIDPATGVATVLDTLDVQLAGTVFGVDVNPQADALRIVSNSGQNLRHPFATGTTVADTPLTYGAGQAAPQVTAAAYTDNVAGTTTTRLFDIDSERNVLVRQDPPNAGTLTVVGSGLGVDVLFNNGFDVDGATGTAFASLQTATGVSLFRIDLTSGTATRVGGLANTVEDITVATPAFRVTDATVTEGGTATITVSRSGDLADAQTVDFATASGSASEGSDFTRTTGTVSFAAGESTKSIRVATSGEGGLEGVETFSVVLSNPASGAVVSPSRGTVTVTDRENGQLYALLNNNALRTVSVNDPSANGTTVPLIGLAAGDDLVGIDVRPSNGEVLAVGTSGRLYVVDPRTGVASARGNAISPALSGTALGVDVNPQADRLRVVSNNGQNLRINPDTGDTITDGRLDYPAGDPNDLATPAVAGAAYTNNVAGATTTTLFDVDTATDALVRQDPPNDGVLRTVGTLGVSLAATSTVGIDIAGLGGNAFAALQPEAAAGPSLYRVDLTTGQARLLGAFSTAGGTVEDITAVPAAPASPTPSASPSATPTSTTSASPSAAPFGQLAIRVSPNVITPGVESVVTVTGVPGSVVELQAYSRPSTEYTVVRRGTIPASGTVEFRVKPGTNTRLFAQVTGFERTASPSVVINVRTALSLTVKRNGPRDYTFQGRILPRRPGQLITLYRVADGREIITKQIKTDDSGTYFISRKFTGSGTFGFLTRTGQTLTNAAGVSNEGKPRPTAIF